MASEGPGLPCERNFGHCIISWRIENFSLAVCNPEAVIKTEEFSVSSPETTRWHIGFYSESDTSNLQMFLKRLDDEVDEILRVAWKITMLNGKGEELFDSRSTSYIERNSQYLVDLMAPLDILSVLPAEEPDQVTFAFQMIIVFTSKPMKFQTAEDVGLKALLGDMETIYKTGHHSDVTAAYKGGSLNLHRAVICPRSKKLADSAGHESQKRIQLCFSDTEAVCRLFAYLYTGDLKHILDPPLIPIYDYIVNLDIKELEDAYPQEKIFMETLIEAKTFKFQWTIPELINNNEFQDSDVYEADGMGSSWKLRIHPKGLSGGSEIEMKYVYIEAFVVSSHGPQDVYIDFRVGNDTGPLIIARRMHGKVIAGNKLGIPLMRTDGLSMTKAVVDNTLNISFSVHIATGKINSATTETRPLVPFDLTSLYTYSILVNYLGCLQTENTYSDVTLLVEGQEFKSHKFLLAGRSTTFSRMLEKMKDDSSSSLTIHDMDKHVFRVFLDYLYRGILTDTDAKVLMQLYDTAAHFAVKGLESVCAESLRDNITPQNSCYVLMFAEERALTSLQIDALHMIDTYRDYIVDCRGWIDLAERCPHLFTDVVNFLTHNFKSVASDSSEIDVQEGPMDPADVQSLLKGQYFRKKVPVQGPADTRVGSTGH